jgi:hypothetical protein
MSTKSMMRRRRFVDGGRQLAQLRLEPRMLVNAGGNFAKCRYGIGGCFRRGDALGTEPVIPLQPTGLGLRQEVEDELLGVSRIVPAIFDLTERFMALA